MSSVTKKESGVELLRFISIFCILIVHVITLIFRDLGYEKLVASPSPTITQAFFLSLSIICVDVFVIISGWYGIHATTKGLCKLIFQCFFFGLIGYVVSAWLGYSALSLSGLIKLIFNSFFPGWFLASYIVLYILSPILNKFVENTPKSVIQKILYVIFAFVFVYGWVFTEDSANAYTFKSGYSSTFLIILYVLSRYVRICYFSEKAESQILLSKSKRFWFASWWGILVGDVLLWTLFTWLNVGQISSRVFMYTAPMIIAQSFCMFRYFQMQKFSNSFVNWLGASSLAVMLVHGWCNLSLLRGWVLAIYNNNSGLICILLIVSVLIAVSVVGVLLDQVRIVLWKPIESRVKWIKLYD